MKINIQQQQTNQHKQLLKHIISTPLNPKRVHLQDGYGSQVLFKPYKIFKAREI